MYRSRTNRRTDRRVFTRTADNVHPKNFSGFVTPQRGGTRL